MEMRARPRGEKLPLPAPNAPPPHVRVRRGVAPCRAEPRSSKALIQKTSSHYDGSNWTCADRHAVRDVDKANSHVRRTKRTSCHLARRTPSRRRRSMASPSPAARRRCPSWATCTTSPAQPRGTFPATRTAACTSTCPGLWASTAASLPSRSPPDSSTSPSATSTRPRLFWQTRSCSARCSSGPTCFRSGSSSTARSGKGPGAKVSSRRTTTSPSTTRRRACCCPPSP